MMGLFRSQDTRTDPATIGYRGGNNLYQFVSNNPQCFRDRFGELPLGYVAIDKVKILTDASQAEVFYPSAGRSCACWGRKMGDARLNAVWLDADPKSSVKNAASDTQGSYEAIASWPFMAKGSLTEFEDQSYVGAGFAAGFQPTKIGSLCCKSFSWHNDKKGSLWGWSDDGTFKDPMFVDSPGGYANQFSGTTLRNYRLQLLCDGEVVGEWPWSYSVEKGSVFTVTLTTPF